MLTQDEIEDSFDTAFLQSVEDLPDEQLQLMMHNVRELRRLAPPSLAVSRAREIVADILARRAPPPEPEPEPEPEPTLSPEMALRPMPEQSVRAFAPLAEAPSGEAREPAWEEPPENEAPELEDKTEGEDAAADAPLPTEPPPNWAHPSVTLELPASPLRRMLHWFFG